MIKSTSKNAYFSIVGQEPTQFDKILASMESGRTYTRRELAHRVGMETATMSARVNSLVKLGKIRELGRKICAFSKKEVEALVKIEPKPVTFNLF